MLKYSISSSDKTCIQPQIAVFPSAGMGHLIPFLRLAAMFSSRNCSVTLITAKPMVSASEATYISSFVSAHPQIKLVEFAILPLDPTGLTIKDPFMFQFEAIRRSVHLLVPLLSTQPYSAIFTDVTLTASMADIANDLRIPNYVVFTSSAKFLSLMTYIPIAIKKNLDAKSRDHGSDDEFDIPGTSPLPKSSIPLPFSDPAHFFTKEIVSNALAFPKAKGIVVNTFESFESEALFALNNGSITSNLPPVLAIGPLEPYDQIGEKQCQCVQWLDSEKAESVVYISFGSRTAVSADQIREIGNGLERSGFKFLWVLKTSKVDRDETEEELNELLGDEFLERTKSRGMIVKEWVNQEAILAHPAIGCFVSHCGWNSLTEAAKRGIRILAWPLHGDQRVNAEVVVKAGMGTCDRTWGWGGEKVVKGEEIGNRVRELMEDEKLKTSARKIGEEARKARGFEGTSEKTVLSIIKMLNVENK